MNPPTDNEIIHRWHRGQSGRQIARELQVSRWRVARVLQRQQAARNEVSAVPAGSGLPRPPVRRGSQLDTFEGTIRQLLERYPHMTAIRVLEELRKAGYRGGYTILRQRVQALRRQPQKPLVVRFETAPGVQGQMDWAVYDLDFTREGRRRVNLFGYVLGYSRREYLHFTERQDSDTTLQQHIQAFHYLEGVAATCLYDNLKVVVTRWEDEQPIYNTRFLSFATHYGFRPWACRPRRPETKGKVERPFHYVELSLLNGRTFHSLEHLNEVTRWWLANVADVRVHGTTKKRPLDAHAEERPHLLPLPAQDYDTARVVYRIVDEEGYIRQDGNQYSVPWQLVGALLPVRITATEVLVYDTDIRVVARHPLLRGVTGQQQRDPQHRPPRNQALQLEQLRARFGELGEIALRFLEGLLKKQRYGKQQAQRALLLISGYHRSDVLAALERAVRYHAYSVSSLERILNAQATPKASWQLLSEQQQETLRKLTDVDGIDARSSDQYQYLLSEEPATDDREGPSRPDTAPENPPASGDTQHPAEG
jgi:transposase